MRLTLLPLLTLSVACGPSRGTASDTACGIAAVAGPSLVLSEFGTPGAPLATPPVTLPARLVARFVAGPASPAVVGRRSDSLEIGVEGGIPPNAHPGFGVLMIDPQKKVLGVLVFDGTPILGAAVLGNVTAGPTRVPLIGVMIDPARVQDSRCPFFPDSVLQ